jgi:hypothetical protein
MEKQMRNFCNNFTMPVFDRAEKLALLIDDSRNERSRRVGILPAQIKHLAHTGQFDRKMSIAPPINHRPEAV